MPILGRFHDVVSKMLGRLENGNVARFNHNLFIGARIPRRTWRPFLNPKRAESTYFNTFLVFQRIFDDGQKTINNGFGFDFGQPGARGYAIDDVCFGHF